MQNLVSLSKMVIIMLIAGLLSTMNIYAVNISHIKLHLNDFYMVGLMISWTMILTLFLDFNNYIIIIITIISLFVILYAIRTQLFVSDRQFLNGMIPHHSMAILMSKNILRKTKDERIIKLAQNIIKTQNQEIELMQNILS